MTRTPDFIVEVEMFNHTEVDGKVRGRQSPVATTTPASYRPQFQLPDNQIIDNARQFGGCLTIHETTIHPGEIKTADLFIIPRDYYLEKGGPVAVGTEFGIYEGHREVGRATILESLV